MSLRRGKTSPVSEPFGKDHRMTPPFAVHVLAAPFVGAELAAIIKTTLVPGCQDVKAVCSIQSLTNSSIDTVEQDRPLRNVALVVATSGWDLLTELWMQQKPFCAATVLALNSQHPNTNIQIATATAQGVRVFLTADDTIETLSLALRAAARGQTYTSNQLRAALKGKPPHSDVAKRFPMTTGIRSSSYVNRASSLGGLSQRQREVALLAAEGLSNKEIAVRLHIDITTVKTHLEETYRKMGICRRSQLVHHLVMAL